MAKTRLGIPALNGVVAPQVSAMSVAFTRGLQGDDLRAGVIACAKHFLGYAVTEAGQNMAATAVGPASSTTSTPAPSRPRSGWPASPG